MCDQIYIEILAANLNNEFYILFSVCVCVCVGGGGGGGGGGGKPRSFTLTNYRQFSMPLYIFHCLIFFRNKMIIF